MCYWNLWITWCVQNPWITRILSVFRETCIRTHTPALLPVAYNNLPLYPSPSVHCFLLIQELYSAASGPTLNERGLLIAWWDTSSRLVLPFSHRHISCPSARLSLSWRHTGDRLEISAWAFFPALPSTENTMGYIASGRMSSSGRLRSVKGKDRSSLLDGIALQFDH